MNPFLLNRASRPQVLLGDEQADLPLVHERRPAVERGHADMGDHLREGRVLIRGHDNQHGGCLAVIRQLHHLVLEALGRAGLAWGGRTTVTTYGQTRLL